MFDQLVVWDKMGILRGPSQFGPPIIVANAWDQNNKSSGMTLSNNNLTATAATSTNYNTVRAIVPKNIGKFYFEVFLSNIGSDNEFGVVTPGWAQGTFVGSDNNSWGYYTNGGSGHAFYHNNVATQTTLSVIAGGRGMIALDATAGNLWFGTNGTWASGDPGSGTAPTYTGVTGNLYPAISLNQSGNSMTAAFASGFAYTLPTGFSPWA